MEDHGISLNRFCPCRQTQCRIRGNCVVCVQNHLEHRRHLPECFQDMLRSSIRSLAEMVELKSEEGRPGPPFWERSEVDERLFRSLARHGGGKKAPPVKAGPR